MFSSSLRTAPRHVLPAHRTLRSFSPSPRSYLHGKARQGHSHRDTSSTYFPQPPPPLPPRKWAQWALGLAAWSIACFAAGTYVWTRGRASTEMIVLKMLSHYKVATDTVDRARVTPAVGMALADEILGERSGATDAPNAVTHTCMSRSLVSTRSLCLQLYGYLCPCKRSDI